MARTETFSSHVRDYAKAVHALESRQGAAVSTNALAERLRVTAGSVSGMVRKLSVLGLLEHEPYRGVRLTDEGRRVALEVLRHHRLLELFLAEDLGMPWDRVHAKAEGRFVRVSDSDPEVRSGTRQLPLGGQLARAMRIELEESPS